MPIAQLKPVIKSTTLEEIFEYISYHKDFLKRQENGQAQTYESQIAGSSFSRYIQLKYPEYHNKGELIVPDATPYLSKMPAEMLKDLDLSGCYLFNENTRLKVEEKSNKRFLEKNKEKVLTRMTELLEDHIKKNPDFHVDVVESKREIFRSKAEEELLIEKAKEDLSDKDFQRDLIHKKAAIAQLESKIYSFEMEKFSQDNYEKLHREFKNLPKGINPTQEQLNASGTYEEYFKKTSLSVPQHELNVFNKIQELKRNVSADIALQCESAIDLEIKKNIADQSSIGYIARQLTGKNDYSEIIKSSEKKFILKQYDEIFDRLEKEFALDEKNIFSVEDNVHVIRLENTELNEYVTLHNEFLKNQAAGVNSTDDVKKASGSLNDYLQKIYGEEFPDKIIIGEINGTKSISAREDKKYDCSKVNLENADLSGSRIISVDFINTDFSNLSIRDAFVEDVSFQKCNLSGSDLRGVNLDEVKFFQYDQSNNTHLLNNIKMNYASCDKMQEIRAFRINNGVEYAAIKKRISEEVFREKEEKIKKVTEEITKKNIYNLDDFRGIFKETRSSVAIEIASNDAKKIIEKEFAKILEDRLEEALIKQSCTVNVSLINPQSDSTYVYKQDEQVSRAKNLYFEVSTSDLDNFKNQHKVDKKKSSFYDYCINKYGQDIKNIIGVDSKDQQKIIFKLPSANLQAKDLSGLNLDGIDLSYSNLSGANLSNSSLKGACLEGCNLTAANFQQANLKDSNLAGVKGEEVNFEKCFMLRTRLEFSKLPRSKFDGAMMQSSNITKADLESTSLQFVNLNKCLGKKVNLAYADARHASFKAANLTEAVIKNADFSEASLEDAVLNKADARRTIFTGANMDNIQAVMANFRETVLDNVRAKKGNFSGADFENLKSAFKADFSKSVMNMIDASNANFEGAVLNDVEARSANFRNAILKEVEAERIDIRDSVLEKANLHSANLKGAVLNRVNAKKADFLKANLSEAELIWADCQNAVFQEANLIKADISNANLGQANLSNSNVKDLKFNQNTNLVDIKKSGIKNDSKELINQAEIQSTYFGKILGGSNYPTPLTLQGRQNRYEAQLAGAAAITAMIGAGVGYFSGRWSGFIAAGIAGFFSIEVINLNKDKDKGYVDSPFGDLLACIGAVVARAGAQSAEDAVVSSVVMKILDSSGLFSGVGSILSNGLSISPVSVIMSNFMTVVETSTIAGLGVGGYNAIVDLKKGVPPEEVFAQGKSKLQRVLDYIVPSVKKIVAGLAVGALAIGLAVATFYAIVPLTVLVGTVIPLAATVGAFTGYFGKTFFDRNIFKPKQEPLIENKPSEKTSYDLDKFDETKAVHLKQEVRKDLRLAPDISNDEAEPVNNKVIMASDIHDEKPSISIISPKSEANNDKSQNLLEKDLSEKLKSGASNANESKPD